MPGEAAGERHLAEWSARAAHKSGVCHGSSGCAPKRSEWWTSCTAQGRQTHVCEHGYLCYRYGISSSEQLGYSSAGLIDADGRDVHCTSTICTRCQEQAGRLQAAPLSFRGQHQGPTVCYKDKSDEAGPIVCATWGQRCLCCSARLTTAESSDERKEYVVVFGAESLNSVVGPLLTDRRAAFVRKFCSIGQVHTCKIWTVASQRTQVRRSALPTATLQQQSLYGCSITHAFSHCISLLMSDPQCRLHVCRTQPSV